MKNRKFLLTLSLASILALVGCNKGKKNPSTTDNGSSGTGQVNPNTSDDDTSTGEQSSDEIPSYPQTQAEADALLEKALSADYSNMTVDIYDQNEIEESWEAIEYCVDGYQIIDHGGESSGYLYYHDYADSNYLWLEPEGEGKQGAWCNKGAMLSSGKPADLSIWNTYFYMPLLLKNLTKDDATYLGEAIYEIKDDEVVEKFNEKVFYFGWFHNVTSVRFSLTSDGYFQVVQAYDDVNDQSDDAPLVQVKISNIGETVAPVSNLPAAPSESNIKEYWQYKGYEGPETPQGVKEITAKADNSAKVEDSKVVVEIEEKVALSYEFTLEDPKANTHPIETKSILWHSSDESIVSVGHDAPKDANGFIPQSTYAVGVKAGEAKVWAEDEYSHAKSNEITIKVNPLGELDKQGCVFDLTFTGMDDQGNVTASNAITNNLPYSIKSNNVNAAYIQDGSNSDIWEDSDQVMLMDCCTQGSGGEAIVEYDFKDQEVTSLSMYYGYYYSVGKDALKWLSEAVIETSNDGATWTTAKDIKKEIIDNFSSTNLKILNASFTKASHVRIRLKSSMVTSGFKFAYSHIVFNADSTCQKGLPTGEVSVSSVTISSAKASVRLNETLALNASVVTNTGSYLKGLVWKSSNEAVATVTSNGNGAILTAVSKGTVKITATAKNYDDTEIVSNELEIEVTDPLSLSDELKNTTFRWDALYLDFWKIDISETTLIIEHLKQTPAVKYTLTLKDNVGRTFTFADENGNTLDVEAIKNGDEVTGLSVKGVLGGQPFKEGNGNAHEFEKFVAATSITISAPSSTTMTVGDTQLLQVTISAGSTTTANDLTWKSSDTTVLTIEDRTVTALAVGSATITAETDYGIKGSITITVEEKVYPTSIEITGYTSALEVNDEVNLSVNYKNTDPTKTVNVTPTVSWSSSDSNVASITPDGELTANKAGDATITASISVNGSNITDTLSVHVNKPADRLSGVIVGKWTGTYQNLNSEDVEATLIINADGSANIDSEDFNFQGGIDLTFASSENNVYTFTEDSDGETEMSVTLNNDNTISVTYMDSNYTFVLSSVSFAKVVPPTSVSIVSPSSTSLTVGDSLQLVAKQLDDTSAELSNTGYDITWESSDITKATVSSTGLVNAIAETASVTITAKIEELNLTDTVTLSIAAASQTSVIPAELVGSWSCDDAECDVVLVIDADGKLTASSENYLLYSNYVLTFKNIDSNGYYLFESSDTASYWKIKLSGDKLIATIQQDEVDIEDQEFTKQA